MPAQSEQEPKNVAVFVIADRLTIGNTDYGTERLPIPLTATEAKSLADLGLVRIIGLFS